MAKTSKGKAKGKAGGSNAAAQPADQDAGAPPKANGSTPAKAKVNKELAALGGGAMDVDAASNARAPRRAATAAQTAMALAVAFGGSVSPRSVKKEPRSRTAANGSLAAPAEADKAGAGKRKRPAETHTAAPSEEKATGKRTRSTPAEPTAVAAKPTPAKPSPKSAAKPAAAKIAPAKAARTSGRKRQRGGSSAKTAPAEPAEDAEHAEPEEDAEDAAAPSDAAVAMVADDAVPAGEDEAVTAPAAVPADEAASMQVDAAAEPTPSAPVQQQQQQQQQPDEGPEQQIQIQIQQQQQIQIHIRQPTQTGDERESVAAEAPSASAGGAAVPGRSTEGGDTAAAVPRAAAFDTVASAVPMLQQTAAAPATVAPARPQPLYADAAGDDWLGEWEGTTIFGSPTKFTTPRAPASREQALEAGSDIPGLVALAASAASVEAVCAGIDIILPASKGNNLAARLLRLAFRSLGLGEFPTRKRSVPMVARMLWVLAGREGAAAAQAAAAGIWREDLPPHLQQFGQAEPSPALPQLPLPAAPASWAAEGPSGSGLGRAAAARARQPSEYLSSGQHFERPTQRLSAVQEPSVVLSSFDPRFVRLAELIREALGLGRGTSATLRMVMKTGLLAGLGVHFQNRRGEVLLSGRVLPDGLSICCECPDCGGAKAISPSDFEAHSGSKDRRPADGIFVTDMGHSLKDLLQLANSVQLASDLHMDYCFSCKQGGELVCCDGCTAAYHLHCLDLQAVPEGEWFCSLCKEEGRTKRVRMPAALLPPMLPAFPMGLAPPRRKPGRPPGSGTGRRPGRPPGSGAGRKPGPRPGGYSAPVPGRVHMMAPSTQRRLGRPHRNPNRNKRLFDGAEGGLKHGDGVHYVARGERVLSGVVVINPAGASGIRCSHCDAVVSCSQFEAHAGHAPRRQPYEHIQTDEGVNLKSIAAMLPALPDEAEEEGAGEEVRDGAWELDTLTGGCVLCRHTDFQRGEFGPRTIMLCDQCEREFHVGCLVDGGLTAPLTSLPEGEWFCSPACGHVHTLLRQCVAAGQMDVPGAPDCTWQMLNGRDSQPTTTYAIKAATDILQESFDPIMDLSTNTDLLPLMLHARQYGDWDYRGVYTMLLHYQKQPVVAATVRVFGPQMAELPLIATRVSARRQGFARLLVERFQELLTEAGVHRLVLPAAHETVQTWKSGFAFEEMPEEVVRAAKAQLRILVFPGTEVLWKEMAQVEAPGEHHVLRPMPTKAEAKEVAAVLWDIVATLAAEAGEAAEEPLPLQLQQPEEEAAAQPLTLEAAGHALLPGAETSGMPAAASPVAAGALVAAARPVLAPPPALPPAALQAVLAASPRAPPPVSALDPYEALIEQAMAAGVRAAEAAAAGAAVAVPAPSLVLQHVQTGGASGSLVGALPEGAATTTGS